MSSGYEDLHECGKPCPPTEACEECSPYWNRMIDEGRWDPIKHEWTKKAMETFLA